MFVDNFFVSVNVRYERFPIFIFFLVSDVIFFYSCSDALDKVPGAISVLRRDRTSEDTQSKAEVIFTGLRKL